MIQEVNKTGVRVKGKGEPLTAADINSINDTVNKCVDVINNHLKGYCDINVEESDPERLYTLEYAVKKVPTARRCIGMRIKFRETANDYREYTYAGDSILASEWENVNNWFTGLEIIDGGTW